MQKFNPSQILSSVKNFRLTPTLIKQYVFILLGDFLIAAAFVFFVNPYNYTPGGVYGAGVAMNALFPFFEVGTWGLIFDIPLLVLAFIFLGGHLGLKTIVAALVLPVIMNSMTYMVGSDPATMLSGAVNLSDDVLLACLFGGAIFGVGIGFILKSHATSGGTDIVAMLLSKFIHMPVARALLIIDSFVVIFGLIVFGDWKLPLYSLVTIFVCTKVIDLMLEGGSGDKLVFILSDKHDVIRRYILDDLSRGGTYIKSSGMYTNSPREMIFVVISRREISLLHDFVHQTDDKAFMVVLNAHETLGDGFKEFEKKVGG